MDSSSSSKLSPPLPPLLLHHLAIFTLLIITIPLMMTPNPAAAQPSADDQLPTPPPPPLPSQLPGVNARCSIDLSRLAVCTPLVALVDIGSLSTRPCCGTLLGLVDLEATVCLCLALRANVLGIHVDIPLALNLVLSTCYTNVPHYFQCSIA